MADGATCLGPVTRVDRIFRCNCGFSWRVEGLQEQLMTGRFWHPLRFGSEICPRCNELGEIGTLRDFVCPTCRADIGLPCQRGSEVVSWFHPSRGLTPKREPHGRVSWRGRKLKFRRRRERLHKQSQKIENRRERHKVKRELR